LEKIRSEVGKGLREKFSIQDDVLRYGTILRVPNVAKLKKEIMDEAHRSANSIHLGSTKMYIDLWEFYWWNNMKRETTEYVSQCLICQQVKIEHQKLAGLLQPLTIPEWKWDNMMNFVVRLSRSSKGNDTIWVINRLIKLHTF